MSKEFKQAELIGSLANLGADTEDPCHRCKERTDVECFILAGIRLRRHRLPDSMRVYILMHLFWLYWPWPVLFLVEFVLESVTAESCEAAVTARIRQGLKAMKAKFEGKAVLNNHRLGVPNGREFSAKSLTKNPQARRDGFAMCSDLLKQPSAVYRVCSGVAHSLKQQYSSKRCVSVALLCDVIAAGQVQGLKRSTGYSTIRFARSIIYQEWPRSERIFADTEQDWNKWRVMGGSRRVIKALGIWDYSNARKFRDKVGGAERKRISVGKAKSLGLYSFADLRCFICLAPDSIPRALSRQRKRFRGVDSRRPAAYRQ